MASVPTSRASNISADELLLLPLPPSAPPALLSPLLSSTTLTDCMQRQACAAATSVAARCTQHARASPGDCTRPHDFAIERTCCPFLSSTYFDTTW
jgi:hypothetical protein